MCIYTTHLTSYSTCRCLRANTSITYCTAVLYRIHDGLPTPENPIFPVYTDAPCFERRTHTERKDECDVCGAVPSTQSPPELSPRAREAAGGNANAANEISGGETESAAHLRGGAGSGSSTLSSLFADRAARHAREKAAHEAAAAAELAAARERAKERARALDAEIASKPEAQLSAAALARKRKLEEKREVERVQALIEADRARRAGEARRR
jgi:hypothetical protein